MPPETWTRNPPCNASFPADVFALGAQFWHILTGVCVPWYRPWVNKMRAIAMIVNFSLGQLHHHERIGPKGIELLRKMLHPDPAKRSTLANLLALGRLPARCGSHHAQLCGKSYGPDGATGDRRSA